MKIAITGTSSGIGLRAAEMLAMSGHQVVGLVRSPARAAAALTSLPETARARIELVEVDLASSASIRSAAARLIDQGPLDALINNAAIFDQKVDSIHTTADGHELFWATNHLGPTELTARLSPALAAAPSPSVVFVASKGLITMPRIRIRFEALDGAGWFSPTRAYYHAKLAQIMTAVTLAERYGASVSVSCLRVPAVRLDADRLRDQPALLRALYAPKNRLAAAPERIAEVYGRLIEEPARGPDDLYLDERLRTVPLPAAARDARTRLRLWELTQAAIGSPGWAWDAGRG